MVIDPGETRQAVQAFADEFGWTFEVLLDTDSRVARRYGITGHPTAFLIGPAGTMLGVGVGYRDWQSQEAFQFIEHLLEETKRIHGR